MKAADKALFMATGVRNMKINIPNGKGLMPVTLKDILFCLDLAFMLISLSKCNAAGFTVTLKNHTCLIGDPKGCTIGQIPLIEDLYCTDHESVTAMTTVIKTYSINEAHQQARPYLT